MLTSSDLVRLTELMQDGYVLKELTQQGDGSWHALCADTRGGEDRLAIGDLDNEAPRCLDRTTWGWAG